MRKIIAEVPGQVAIATDDMVLRARDDEAEKGVVFKHGNGVV